jgi:hypothetical protein
LKAQALGSGAGLSPDSSTPPVYGKKKKEKKKRVVS